MDFMKIMGLKISLDKAEDRAIFLCGNIGEGHET